MYEKFESSWLSNFPQWLIWQLCLKFESHLTVTNSRISYDDWICDNCMRSSRVTDSRTSIMIKFATTSWEVRELLMLELLLVIEFVTIFVLTSRVTRSRTSQNGWICDNFMGSSRVTNSRTSHHDWICDNFIESSRVTDSRTSHNCWICDHVMISSRATYSWTSHNDWICDNFMRSSRVIDSRTSQNDWIYANCMARSKHVKTHRFVVWNFMWHE